MWLRHMSIDADNELLSREFGLGWSEAAAREAFCAVCRIRIGLRTGRTP